MPEKQDKYEIVEVPTQTTLVIKDKETNELYNELAILKEIANDVKVILKQFKS